MNFAVERFGGLNCLVNNAGAGTEDGPIADISVEGFDRAIALLLRGPFLVHRLISGRHTVGFKRVWMLGASEERIRCDP